jgi:iron-sulfur cluster assembly protein
MITLTERAAEKIKKSLSKRGHGIGIRIGVRTTGCSGLAYVLEYVDYYNPIDDATIIDNDVTIVVSPKHEPYLRNMTVDYVRNGLNEGFEFTNPNERDRCGCGSSFRI